MMLRYDGSSEISIFKDKYDSIVDNEIIPMLEKVNDERSSSYYIWGIIIAIPVSIAFVYIAYLCFSAGDWLDALFLIGTAFVIPAISAIALENYLLKKFEMKLKTPILPLLLKAIPDFYWQKTPVITKKEIEEILIFPRAKECAKSFDDNFLGKFKGIPFVVGECFYEFHSRHSNPFYFKGIILKIKMNKSFSGHTVVVPNKRSVSLNLNEGVGYFDYYSDLKHSDLEQVKLEDVVFNSKYVVYSTDQVEARYLLTPTFMEKLKNFEKAFLASEIYCVFYKDYIYLAPNSGIDLFNFFQNSDDLLIDTSQFEIFFSQLEAILDLISFFALDTKLGL